jgi:hypothetical protein
MRKVFVFIIFTLLLFSILSCTKKYEEGVKESPEVVKSGEVIESDELSLGDLETVEDLDDLDLKELEDSLDFDF